MKKCICDIDDVITPTSYLDWLNEFKGTNFSKSDLKSYSVEDEILGDNQQEIDDFHDWIVAHKTDFYKDSVLMPECFEVLEKVNTNYDLILVSACVSTSWVFQNKLKQELREKQWGHEFEDKFRFIRRELPFVKPQNIIYTNRKDLIDADIRIDDRLKHLKGKGDTKLLFDSWHNKQISKEEMDDARAVRVNGWNDIDRIL